MKRAAIVPFALLAAAQPARARSQAPPPAPGLFEPLAGYSMQLEVEALASTVPAPPQAAPEAQALLGRIRDPTHLRSRVLLSGEVSRQEILSEDFVLPRNSVVLHKAGDRFYVVASPAARTYAVMDSDELLSAFEGLAGVEDSEYRVEVRHTDERREVGGYPCRRSLLMVSYQRSVPFENERVSFPQRNEIDVWHTAELGSVAALEHFFFRYRRDRTGTVEKTLREQIGFPLELRVTVRQGEGARGAAVQRGSFRMSVRDLKPEAIEPVLLRIPPAGYRRAAKGPLRDAAR